MSNSHVPDHAGDRILDFPDHSRNVVQGLRGAFVELITSAGADPLRPQEVARRFGINKNLAWKVAKVVEAADPATALQHLPGAGGIGILLRALRDGGASASAVEQAESAVADYDTLVKVHSGDRATLELMLNGMLPDHRRGDSEEALRKLAYQGNSAVWGIQARSRFATQILLPSPVEEGQADLMVLGGLTHFRRLRRGARWPLFRLTSYNDDMTPIKVVREPIGAGPRSPGDPLGLVLPEFSGEGDLALEVLEDGNSLIYELSDGPVGNLGAVDCCMGYRVRSIGPVRTDASNRFGEHAMHLYTPSESCQMDLLVHRDLPVELPPRALLYSALAATEGYLVQRSDRDLLPLVESVEEIGSPPILATPTMPAYSRLVQYALESSGVSNDALVGYRISMRFPPIPTVLVLRYPLGPPA